MTVYLDCNATTPIEPDVADELMRYTVEEFGNAGSRTHSFGLRAKKRVNKAREQVAAVADAPAGDLVFTSGATEGNNLAILGLAQNGIETGRTHIVSTAIEHKSVLEPLAHLENSGFQVEYVRPNSGGWVDPEEVADRVKDKTLLVSVQHVNNETGVIQPLVEVAELLDGHPALLHTDAAQGFGKDLEPLRHPGIDLISVSGHKLYAPKGIGALAIKRRAGKRPPLQPLMFGGGQEKGLRPGTHPVGLIASLGLASELAVSRHRERQAKVIEHRDLATDALDRLQATISGDAERILPTTANFSISGLDSEAAIVLLKNSVAVSNGSACTSQSYEPSHVLTAMGLPDDQIAGAIRMSWSHLTPRIPWNAIQTQLGVFVPGSLNA